MGRGAGCDAPLAGCWLGASHGMGAVAPAEGEGEPGATAAAPLAEPPGDIPPICVPLGVVLSALPPMGEVMPGALKLDADCMSWPAPPPSCVVPNPDVAPNPDVVPAGLVVANTGGVGGGS